MKSEETSEFEFDLDSVKPGLGFTFLDLDADSSDDKYRSSASFEWNPAKPGRRFGDYEVVGPLGEGAMAIVVEGRHARTGEKVAIKVLRKLLDRDPRIRARFEREAVAVSQVRSEHVVHVHAYGIARDHPFTVLELLAGGSVRELLDRRLKERKALPVTRALSIVRQTLAGLEGAHNQGLLHRDIKPDNLLLDDLGCVKLADFGLVKMLSASSQQALTTPGVRLGSPLYMAPEQSIGGDVDPRSDLYSVGMTLYELLTGKLPFAGAQTPLAIYEKQIHSPAPTPRRLRRQLDPAVDAFVRRLLDPEPEKRYPSARAARGALLAMQPAPERAAVQIRSAESKQAAILKRGERAVVGRAGQANFVLPGIGVSRFHCAFELTAKGLVVVDLESRNGTFVSGRRVRGRAPVVSGDPVRVGSVRVVVDWGACR